MTGLSSPRFLRIAMILPGVGRVQRGAETAFLAIAKELQSFPDLQVTLFGTGPETVDNVPIVTVGCVSRERFERFPSFPVLRDECCYEEATFIFNLVGRRKFRPWNFDLVVHCTFPFTNWMVQLAARRAKLKSVFVTENGDWMCQARNREYRSFRCDGLICTNPEYYERNRGRYRTELIPNGVDPCLFYPRAVNQPRSREAWLPPDHQLLLMVSALIPSKRVLDGIRAVARVPGVFLLLAGDGPEREAAAALAARELPGRHRLLGSVVRQQMPELYRAADAFLHMSQDEPGCISYLEAAASGLPIVAHDAPIPRWTFGDCAFFANTSDIASVAAAIREALGPAGAARGRAAVTRMHQGWTWAALAARYRSFFHTLFQQQP